MRLLIICFAWLSLWGCAADNGILRKQSPHSVEVTVQRFTAAVKAKGGKVFPNIDHAEAAREYGQQMPAATVIAFGNPKYGTPLMIQSPESAIDFPPKALVYEDSEGQVWLAYNSAAYLYEIIFKRHGLPYTKKDLHFYKHYLSEISEYAVTR